MADAYDVAMMSGPTSSPAEDAAMMRGPLQPRLWGGREYFEESLAWNRPWDEVGEEMRRRFPGTDPLALRVSYQQAQRAQEQQRRLNAARDEFRNYEESGGEYVLRRSIPFISASYRAGEEREAGAAARRIEAGTPREGDYRAVARFERLQSNEKNAGLGGTILSAVASVPAVAGEFYVGGLAVRGIGAGIRALTGRAAAAAPSAITRAAAAPPSLGARLAGGARHAAAVTPFVPSMYLPSLTQNLESGQSLPEAAARAYTYGVIQTAVIGQLFGAGGAGGLGNYLRHTGAALGEAELLSYGAHVSGWQRTGGGVIGSAMRGEWGDAGKHAAASAVAFGILGAGRLRHNRLQGAADSLRRQGYTPEQIEAELTRVHQFVGGLMERGTPRSEALDLVRRHAANNKPLLDYGLDLAGRIPREGAAPRTPPTSRAFDEAMRKDADPEMLGLISERLGNLWDMDPGASRKEAAALVNRFVPRGEKAAREFAASLVRQFPKERIEFGPPRPQMLGLISERLGRLWDMDPGASRKEAAALVNRFVPRSEKAAREFAATLVGQFPKKRIEFGPPRPPEPSQPPPVRAEPFTPPPAQRPPRQPATLTAAEARRMLVDAVHEQIPGLEVHDNPGFGHIGIRYNRTRDKLSLEIDPERLEQWAQRGPDAVRAMAFEEAHHARHRGERNKEEHATNWQHLPEEVRAAVSLVYKSATRDSHRFLEYARMREQLLHLGHITEWHLPGKRAAAERAEATIRAHEAEGGTVLPGRVTALGEPAPGARPAQPRPAPAAAQTPRQRVEALEAKLTGKKGIIERLMDAESAERAAAAEANLIGASKAAKQRLADAQRTLRHVRRDHKQALRELEKARTEAMLAETPAPQPAPPAQPAPPQPAPVAPEATSRAAETQVAPEVARPAPEALAAQPEAPAPVPQAKPVAPEPMASARQVTAPKAEAAEAKKPGEQTREQKLAELAILVDDVDSARANWNSITALAEELGLKGWQELPKRRQQLREIRRQVDTLVPAEATVPEAPEPVKLLESLPPKLLSLREQRILTARLGGASFEEAGREQGVSKQRAEQIEQNALAKLAKHFGADPAKVQSLAAVMELARPEPLPAENVRFRTAARTGQVDRGPVDFKMVETILKLFGVPRYLGGTGKARIDAAADLFRRLTAISKGAAGHPLVALEEASHVAAEAAGIRGEARFKDLKLAAGLKQFDPYGAGDVIEAFSGWAERRVTGNDKNFTPEQQKAAAAFEAWAKGNGLLETIDRLAPMYAEVVKRSPQGQAAAFFAPLGKKPEAELTPGERRADLVQRVSDGFRESVENDLMIAEKLDAAAKARGNPNPDLYARLDGMRHAEKAIAEELAARGAWGIDAEGKREYYGRGLDHVVEPIKGKPHEQAAMDYYHIGHILNEHAAGTQILDALPTQRAAALKALRQEAQAVRKDKTLSEADKKKELRLIAGEAKEVKARLDREKAHAELRRNLVPEDMLADMRRVHAELGQNPELVKDAMEYGRRVTQEFNALPLALSSPGIHWENRERVNQWIAMRPDYVPTDRVLVNQRPVGAGASNRGEMLRGISFRRSGSGEQIKNALVVLQERSVAAAHLIAAQLRRKMIVEFAERNGLGEFLSVAPPGEAPSKGGAFSEAQLRALKEAGVDEAGMVKALKALGGDINTLAAPAWPRDATQMSIEHHGPGGEPQVIRVKNEQLYNLLTDRQLEASNLGRMLSAIAHFKIAGIEPLALAGKTVRALATGASHVFQFMNALVRDPLTYLANTYRAIRGGAGEYLGALGRAYAYEWAMLTGSKSKDRLFNEFVRWRGDQQKEFAIARDKPRGLQQPTVINSIWGLAKGLLRVAGAGEMGPRFLHWKKEAMRRTGLSEAELVKRFEAADAAAANGENYRDPLPYSMGLQLLHEASEVTTPFPRMGVAARPLNTVMPFFGPAIAGASKFIRNWKNNTQNAALGLGIYMGAKLLHYLAYGGEEWWQELSPQDRYNNLVFPAGGRLWRLNTGQGLNIPAGGVMVALLDAANRRNPDIRGLIDTSLEASLPPGVSRAAVSASHGEFFGAATELATTPGGTLAHTALDVARNRSWTRTPIVPQGQEGLPAHVQWAERYGPYVAEQISGRGGVFGDVLRGAARGGPEGAAQALIPVRQVRSAQRSVNDFYRELAALEEDAALARRSGARFDEEGRLRQLRAAERQLQELGRQARGARMVGGRVVLGERPSEATALDLQRRRNEIARRALGR